LVSSLQFVRHLPDPEFWIGVRDKFWINTLGAPVQYSKQFQMEFLGLALLSSWVSPLWVLGFSPFWVLGSRPFEFLGSSPFEFLGLAPLSSRVSPPLPFHIRSFTRWWYPAVSYTVLHSLVVSMSISFWTFHLRLSLDQIDCTNGWYNGI
jgi:hypothetical protein